MRTRYWVTFGRFQPLHDGHVALIRKKLKDGPVLVFLRETGVNEQNPHSTMDRIAMFRSRFPVETRNESLIVRPLHVDIEGVFHGRGVGWKVEEVLTDVASMAISASEIRRGEET